jgi:hypothetical protein
MARDYAHYLFGELAQVSNSLISPAEHRELKDWLDAWLPQWIQTTQGAVDDFDAARALCEAWQQGDHRDEVGVISLHLPEPQESEGIRFTHLVCRVYFNWASAGRVSRTGHAVLLTDERWQALECNPFAVPHLVRNAAAFAHPETLEFPAPDLAEPADERLRALQPSFQREGKAWSSALARIWKGQPPVRVEPDAPQWLFELLLLSLPMEQRRKVSCISSPFGPRADFRQGVDIARCMSGEEPSEALAPGKRPDSCHQGLKTSSLARIRGCWGVNSVGAPIGGVASKAPVESNAAAPDRTPGQWRWLARRLRTGGVALALLSLIAVLTWTSLSWRTESSLQADYDAWLERYNDGAMRRGQTMDLLQEGEALLALDLGEERREPLMVALRQLLELVRGRASELQAKPTIDEADVERIHGLMRGLSRIQSLPLALAADDPAALLPPLAQLRERVARWITEEPVAAGQRERLTFVRASLAKLALAPGPELEAAARSVEAQEQDEELAKIRAAIVIGDALDLARLNQLKGMIAGFREHYPGAREDELQELVQLGADRFEIGVRPVFADAYERLQQEPGEKALDALQAAARDYDTQVAPARALTPRSGIDTKDLLDWLRHEKMIEVRAHRLPSGGPIDVVGRVDDAGVCHAREGFTLLENAMVCVRLQPQQPRNEPSLQRDADNGGLSGAGTPRTEKETEKQQRAPGLDSPSCSWAPARTHLPSCTRYPWQDF